jgi:hypothetical protein
VIAHERADQIFDRAVDELHQRHAPEEPFGAIENAAAHHVRSEETDQGDQGEREQQAEPRDPDRQQAVDERKEPEDDVEREPDRRGDQGSSQEVSSKHAQRHGRASLARLRSERSATSPPEPTAPAQGASLRG